MVARWELEVVPQRPGVANAAPLRPNPSHQRLLALLEGLSQADVARDDWRELLRHGKGFSAFMCLVG